MSTPDRAPKGPRARVGDLRFLSMTAIFGVIVILAAAGFLAGRLTAPTSRKTAQPAATVTVTAPPAHTPTSAPLSATPSASAPEPTSSASPGATSTPGTTGATASNGKQLGSYDIKLPPGFSVPLAAAAPTQSQFVNGTNVGTDLYYSSYLYPENSDKMLTLPSGVTPTYKSCTADTVFVGLMNIVPGATLCLVEATAMVGITIRSVSQAQTFVLLHVTVWKNIS
jgi:hypothetical protein